MGLSLHVGMLADVAHGDPGSLGVIQRQFEALNEALAGHGVAAHAEPADAHPSFYEMFGYSGLHYLRRVAVHVWAEGALPQPGTQRDHLPPRALEERYLRERGGSGGGFLGRLLGRKSPQRPRFDHLLLHSDAEGFYVPADFADVIVSDTVPGGMIGSVPRLLGECAFLSSTLGIPDGLDAESDEVVEASESQGEGEGWQRYGVEVFTCLQLMDACRASLSTGAALVFG